MLAIKTPYRQIFSGLGLDSLESVVAHFSRGRHPKKTTVMVTPTAMSVPGQPDVPAFYKQYEYTPPAWEFMGRASKARREVESYEVFAKLDIPCAEWIACGESRDGIGRLRRAFILTRAIPDATNLIDFVQEHCPDGFTGQSRMLRAGLRRGLASIVRRIHAAGFFHHDLVWRNLLVTWQPPAEPKLWLIDCPRGSFRRWQLWRRRPRLKDLASLDKSATKFCTRAERVAFVREYLGLKRLDAAAKCLIRDALSYRKLRWPEDWNEH